MRVVIEDVNGPIKRELYSDFTKNEPENIDVEDYRDLLGEIEFNIQDILYLAKRGKK